MRAFRSPRFSRTCATPPPCTPSTQTTTGRRSRTPPPCRTRSIVTTPEQLLADPGWRRKHSIYTLWAFLFGFGFIGFLYTGLRASNRKWVTLGVVYAVTVLGAIILVG